MAKDKICTPFLALASPENKFTVSTIEDMKGRKYLKIGDVVELNGYYTAGDGAGHKRKIEAVDDGSGVQLANGLWANIVHSGEVDISWFGAKGDGVTVNDNVIKIFNDTKITKIYINKGIYVFSKMIQISCNIESYTNFNETIIKLINEEILDTFVLVNKDALNIKNVQFDGGSKAVTTVEVKAFNAGQFSSCRFKGGLYSNLIFLIEGNKNSSVIDNVLIDSPLDPFIELETGEFSISEKSPTTSYVDFDVTKIPEYCITGHKYKRNTFALIVHNTDGSKKLASDFYYNETESRFNLYEDSSFLDDADKIEILYGASIIFEHGGDNGTITLQNSSINTGKGIALAKYGLMGLLSLRNNFNSLKLNVMIGSAMRGARCTIFTSINDYFEGGSAYQYLVSLCGFFSVTPCDGSTSKQNVFSRSVGHVSVSKSDANIVSYNKSATATNGQDVEYIIGIDLTLTITRNTHVGFPVPTEVRLYSKKTIGEKKVTILLKEDDIADYEIYGDYSTNVIDIKTGEYISIFVDYTNFTIRIIKLINKVSNIDVYSLNTPYHATKMQQEGVYEDFVAYMDEKTEYDRLQRELEQQRQLEFEQSGMENYEEWLAEQPMLLPAVEEPQPSEALLKFKEKYLG